MPPSPQVFPLSSPNPACLSVARHMQTRAKQSGCQTRAAHATTQGPFAENLRMQCGCFLANSTSHCADDSAIILQSTVREISQQPQITDT